MWTSATNSFVHSRIFRVRSTCLAQALGNKEEERKAIPSSRGNQVSSVVVLSYFWRKESFMTQQKSSIPPLFADKWCLKRKGDNSLHRGCELDTFAIILIVHAKSTNTIESMDSDSAEISLRWKNFNFISYLRLNFSTKSFLNLFAHFKPPLKVSVNYLTHNLILHCQVNLSF